MNLDNGIFGKLILPIVLFAIQDALIVHKVALNY